MIEKLNWEEQSRIAKEAYDRDDFDYCEAFLIKLRHFNKTE